MAPRQRHFVVEEATDHAWTTSTMTRLEPVLQLLGATPRLLRFGSPGGRVVDVEEIELLYIAQGSSGLAAWVRSSKKSTTQPAIRVKVTGPSHVRLLFPDTMAAAAEPITITGGTHTIAMPRATTRLVIVSDAR
jgi:hypothetical protein